MDQTLYEIAEDFESILSLMDELTDPRGPRCQFCNPEGWDELEYNLNRTAMGETDEVCPECEGVGWMGPPDDDAMLEAIGNAMDEVEMSLSHKVENIMRLIQSWDVMEAAIKAEETRLRDKRKAYENKRARLKKYLAKHMARTGQKKVETVIKNAHLYKGRASVVIDDEYALPQGTFDTEMIIKPDKKMIGERLKKEIPTPGAHVETGDPYVVFR